MNVSSWSIRNPTPAILFFLLLTLAGLIGFQGMKIQQFMDIELPTVTVTASLPGAAPAQMETEVARKIENSVATLQGIKHIYTKVQDGTAIVTVEFRLEKPTQEAVDDVRDAVSRIRADLPGDLKDPVVSKVNLSGAPILTYTVASPRMDDEALSWFVDNTVSKALLAVRGVGAVSRVGGVSREVRVELDPARLLALRVSAAEVSRQVRQIQQEAAGGRSDIGGIEQSVRTIGTVQSAAELAAMDLATWNLSLARNLTSAFLLTRALLPGMLVFTVSAQFLTRSIESWFNVQVETALDRGLDGELECGGEFHAAEARRQVSGIYRALVDDIAAQLVAVGAQFLRHGIAVQHDSRHFLPVRILGLGVEEPQIGHEMPFVIGGYGVAGRRFIAHIGIEFDGNPHSHSPSTGESLACGAPPQWPL